MSFDKDKKAKEIMDKMGLDPETRKMAEKAYSHSKDCRLCRMLTMMIEQIMVLHMEEHEESLR